MTNNEIVRRICRRQQEIARDWVKMYERLIGPLPDYRP
jgi:hypothetical protein